VPRPPFRIVLAENDSFQAEAIWEDLIDEAEEQSMPRTSFRKPAKFLKMEQVLAKLPMVCNKSVFPHVWLFDLLDASGTDLANDTEKLVSTFVTKRVPILGELTRKIKESALSHNLHTDIFVISKYRTYVGTNTPEDNEITFEISKHLGPDNILHKLECARLFLPVIQALNR
jgi:hypothetical protein